MSTNNNDNKDNDNIDLSFDDISLNDTDDISLSFDDTTDDLDLNIDNDLLSNTSEVNNTADTPTILLEEDNTIASTTDNENKALSAPVEETPKAIDSTSSNNLETDTNNFVKSSIPGSSSIPTANELKQNDNTNMADNLSDSKTKKTKEKKPMKKRTKILVTVLLTLLIFGGVGTYLAFVNPVTANYLMTTMLEPADYYHKVESNSLDNIKDVVNKNYEPMINAIKNASSTSVANSTTITLSDGLNSFTALLGEYASIISSIKSITLNSDVYIKGDTIGYVFDILLNDGNIVKVNFILDKKNLCGYIQCPTIFKRWIKFSLSDSELKATESALDFTKGITLTKDDIISLIDKYMSIAVLNLKDAKLIKNKNVTINNTQAKINELQVKITQKTMCNIASEILKEAKNDDIIYKFLETNKLFTSKTDYIAVIDNILKNIETSASKADNKQSITMRVLVNNKGKITGRIFETVENKSTINIGYMSTSNKDNSKYEIFYNDPENSISIKGDDTTNKNASTGSLNLDIKLASLSNITDQKNNNTDTTDESSSIIDFKIPDKLSLAVSYSDLQYVDKEKGLMKGKLNLALNGLPKSYNPNIQFNFDVVNNKQNSELIFNLLSKEMLKISSKAIDSTQKDVTIPEKSIALEDLQKNKVTQYNALLEVDYLTVGKSIIKAVNNPTVSQLIKAYYSSTGYNFLNGKQTPRILKYLALKDPEIKAIYIAGVQATKKKTNPGLD